MGFPGGSEVTASAWNVGDPGSIPGLGRSPGEGTGNPLQYSCLENPMDRGAWWATVHGVTKSRTQLSDFISLHFTLCSYSAWSYGTNVYQHIFLYIFYETSAFISLSISKLLAGSVSLSRTPGVGT